MDAQAVHTTLSQQVPEWNDTQRIRFFYAPFRSSGRDADPVGWDSKLGFWVRVLDGVCRATKRVSFQVKDVRAVLTRENLTPSSLSQAVELMISSAKLTTFDELRDKSFSRQTDRSRVSSIVSIAMSPLRWSASRVMTAVTGPRSRADNDTVLVVDTAVRQYGELLLHSARRKALFITDYVLTLSQLSELLVETGVSLPIQDMRALVLALDVQDKLRAVFAGHELLGAKFSRTEDDKLTARPSDADRSILHLKLALANLSAQQEHLHERVVKLAKQKQQFLKAQKKDHAIVIAKQLIPLRRAFDKRRNAIANIDLVLLQMQEADSDALILTAYERGASALHQLRDESGVTIERVENARDDLEAVLMYEETVSEVLAEPIGANDDAISEEDLAKELAELELEIADEDAKGNNSPSGGTPSGKKEGKMAEEGRVPQPSHDVSTASSAPSPSPPPPTDSAVPTGTSGQGSRTPSESSRKSVPMRVKQIG